MSRATASILPANGLGQNTTYQSVAPEGYQSIFGAMRPTDGRKTDYSDGDLCITTLPPPGMEELGRDGSTQCMCTGWFKCLVLSTPGFPSPVVRPPKITYAVRETKGRGIGVYATEDIRAGDLIIAERPLLVKAIWHMGTQDGSLSQELMMRGMMADMEKHLEIMCSRMPPEGVKALKSLCNCRKTDGSGPLSGIMHTNSFDVGVEDPTAIKVLGKPGQGRYACVGAISSRLNHDCSPNAVHSFNMPSFSMGVFAVRPITKGEEITVSYVGAGNNAATRRTLLKPYGFVCVCAACKDAVKSDKERARALTALLPKSSQGVENAKAILAAYEATGLQCDSRYPDLLHRVAKILRKNGSRERADALDTLAERIMAAINGSHPEVPEGAVPPTRPPTLQNQVFESPEDVLKFIRACPDPEERMKMMQSVMRHGVALK